MKIKETVTFLLTALLCLSCFSFFACDRGENKTYNVTYNITYTVADGILPSGAVSEYSVSDKDIELPTPTRAGYTFTGWNNGTEIITVIAAGTTGDLNLTATWQAKSYTITFDYGEGSGTETIRNVTYGLAVTDLPTATPPTGKTFAGFKDESNNVFANGTSYNFERNITLTASYSTNEYSVTYNVAGGNPLSFDAITTYSISAQDIELPTPTKTGYTFTGWDNGTEVITVIAANTIGNLDLTATWQAKTYTITFDYGEGSGTETIRNVTYGLAVTDLPTATPPTGKTFEGWKKTDNSLFGDGDKYLYDENITLTAFFGVARFTVTLDNTDAGFTAWADGSTGSKTVVVDFGEKLTIPQIVWDTYNSDAKGNSDYYFYGWFYRDKNNVEKNFDPNVTFTFENLNVNTYNIIVYAEVSSSWTDYY